jgi:hypothetical protein
VTYVKHIEEVRTDKIRQVDIRVQCLVQACLCHVIGQQSITYLDLKDVLYSASQPLLATSSAGFCETMRFPNKVVNDIIADTFEHELRVLLAEYIDAPSVVYDVPCIDSRRVACRP